MELTAEQARIAEENHNLIYSFLHTRNLNFEDWYDVCAIAFCRSITKYDGSRGSKLSVYTYQAMDFAVMTMKRNMQKRMALTTALSLDAPIDIEGTDSIVLLDVLGGEDREILSIENQDMIDHYLSKLSPVERKAVCLYGTGRTMHNVAEMMGYSQPHISRILSKVHGKMRAERRDRP